MIAERRSYNGRVFSPIGSLLESDALALYRYFGSWRGAAGYLQPEKRLMFAVLLDAVERFQKYPFAHGNKVSRHVEDEADWIFKDDQEWPFSFINICEAVGIDPQYLRSGLLRRREQTVPSRQKRTVSSR